MQRVTVDDGVDVAVGVDGPDQIGGPISVLDGVDQGGLHPAISDGCGDLPGLASGVECVLRTGVLLVVIDAV